MSQPIFTVDAFAEHPFQASARGGVVRMRVNGERVLMSGKAVTVLRGELLVLNVSP